MPKIRYESKRFNDEKMTAISHVNRICENYARQGYDVTLRQVYYRFVAIDLFPDSRRYVLVGSKWRAHPSGTKNAEPNYKWLGELINDGRLAGLIDWNHIMDRTRNLRAVPHFNSPEAALSDAVDRFYRNLWDDQPQYLEVWVEKDALAGIVGKAATGLDVPYFSCRGYTSQSEMWGASQRIGRMMRKGKNVTILHLGDHDPSGVDMTRDIRERLMTFIKHDQTAILSDTAWKAVERQSPDLARVTQRLGDLPTDMRERIFAQMAKVERSWGDLNIDRIALNMDQIEEYAPPPNPAKLTDPRAKRYIEEFGDESWELDALPPEVLDALITSEISEHIDDDLWMAAEDVQTVQRAEIAMMSLRYKSILAYAKEQGWVE